MKFQALDDKERNFLELLNDNLNTNELIYSKGESWLKHFKHSNLLCTKITRAIVNYTSIGKYWLRFFLQDKFACSCSNYPIKIRRYILYKYRRYNNY